MCPLPAAAWPTPHCILRCTFRCWCVDLPRLQLVLLTHKWLQVPWSHLAQPIATPACKLTKGTCISTGLGPHSPQRIYPLTWFSHRMVSVLTLPSMTTPPFHHPVRYWYLVLPDRPPIHSFVWTGEWQSVMFYANSPSQDSHLGLWINLTQIDLMGTPLLGPSGPSHHVCPKILWPPLLGITQNTSLTYTGLINGCLFVAVSYPRNPWVYRRVDSRQSLAPLGTMAAQSL